MQALIELCKQFSECAMELRSRVLLIGDDDDLRLTRDMILRKHGYQVVSVASNSALKSPPDGQFQVAVISQSIPSARALRLASLLRERYPDVRILRIQETGPYLGNNFDLSCESLAGPIAFLAAIQSLCERQLAKTDE
jgi:DNA-binding NtrC family response regulator